MNKKISLPWACIVDSQVKLAAEMYVEIIDTDRYSPTEYIRHVLDQYQDHLETREYAFNKFIEIVKQDSPLRLPNCPSPTNIDRAMDIQKRLLEMSI